MKGSTRKVVRGVLNALMLGAIGFGATQALASPPAGAARAGCSREQFDQCRAECWAQYGRFAQTSCNYHSLYGVSCSCGPPVFPTGG